MKLTDFYTAVSRTVDTGKTEINAADTRRVLSEAFILLNSLDTAECADVIAKGLNTAAKKAATKPAKKAPAKKKAVRKKK